MHAIHDRRIHFDHAGLVRPRAAAGVEETGILHGPNRVMHDVDRDGAVCQGVAALGQDPPHERGASRIAVFELRRAAVQGENEVA